MVYTLDALHRFPMVSRIAFIECGGNSAPLYAKEPIQADLQALHGLVSCAEWTGVMLSTARGDRCRTSGQVVSRGGGRRTHLEQKCTASQSHG